MRSLGQNPTEKELTELINKYDDGSGKIDLEDFFILMYEKMHGIDIYLNTREVYNFFVLILLLRSLNPVFFKSDVSGV